MGLFILIPSFYRGGNRFTLGMGLAQGYVTGKCQPRLVTGLPTSCRVLSSLYIAVSDTSLLFLFVISVVCELAEGETARKFDIFFSVYSLTPA